MCRRAFIRYVYYEISNFQNNAQSIIKFNDIDKKYDLIPGITFHLFTTHGPCGDASIYDKYSNTDEETNEPQNKRSKLQLSNTTKELSENIGDVLSNASSFTGAKIILTNYEVPHDLMIQDIGKLRTKPGRGVRTLSMSCSDKLARWNILGVQGALLHSLMHTPIYLESIVLCGDQSDVHALERAIWKRWSHLEADITLPSNFKITKPNVHTCASNIRFKHQKQNGLNPTAGSIAWCRVIDRLGFI